MSRIRFCLLGGDYRYKYLCDLLKQDGYIVKSYGNNAISNCEQNIYEAVSDMDVVIAPIPISKDDKHILLSSEVIEVDELLSIISNANIKNIICGVVSDNINKKCQTLGIKIYDFFSYEEVAIKNAIPTAEGAIMTAMQESAKTLFGSKSLIIGYGRCGKILASALSGLGASVSVTYRNTKDKAYINAYKLNPINIKEMSNYINQYDFIFNTAPHIVLDKEMLKRIQKSATIIDLAQAPGGVDYSYAKKLNIKALYCPGMPGRTAPFTAAEILKDIVITIAMDI